MSAQAFSHPNFGKEARVEQCGREVRLILVAGTEAQAADLARTIVGQLKGGALNLTMMGRPTGIIESGPER